MTVWSVLQKQSQTNPIIRLRSGRDKANIGSLSNLSPRDLFDHIENLVLKTKLRILILQDMLDILLINEALRLIRRVQVISF